MATWEHVSDPETLAKLILHPNHGGVVRTISELIGDVRQASGLEGLRVVQERLASAVVEAERRYGSAHRLVRRREGDPIDALFWRRTCVQLRAVGDAVAWRFIGYRRRWIYLFGANQDPGLWTKAGFEQEWQEFETRWENGQPALLTGLTNCIRLGDVLVANGEVLEAVEVKRGQRKVRGAQKRRLIELVRQINESEPVRGPGAPAWILESPVPYATHWTHAQPEVDRALKDGFASWVPEEGVGVMISSWRASAMVGKDKALAAQQREQERAGMAMGGGVHAIQVKSFNYPFRSRFAAPLSIFPVTAETAALLITGELLVTTEIRVEAMVNALRRHGLDARNLLEGQAAEQPLPGRLISWKTPLGGSVLRGAMEELGIELTVLDAWAEARARAVRPAGAPSNFVGHLCLSGEEKVWT
jgi:hypothetical protein